MFDVNNIDTYLNSKQKEVCQTEGNILITACPGSGKTRTLIYKTALLLKEKPNSLRKIVALTYTNRASEEISNRINDLELDTTRLWTGTIHQFCLDMILNKNRRYLIGLTKGYTIIDEYVRKKYVNDIIKSNQRYDGILSSDINFTYSRELKYNEEDSIKKEILKEYIDILTINREIDFDQILAYAYKLLKENPFISVSLKNLIEIVFVDEYQDTQELQYAILEEIFKSESESEFQFNINFFGDSNQAIYSSIGGVSKNLLEINSIFGNSTFREITLDGCYRSPQKIIDFYSKFMVNKYEIIQKGDDFNATITYDTVTNKNLLVKKISGIIKSHVSQGIKQNKICIIAPNWYLLFDFSKKIRTEMPDYEFDCPELTPLKRDYFNPAYIICALSLFDSNLRMLSKKRFYYKRFKSILSNEYNISIDNYDFLDFLTVLNKSKSSETKGLIFLEKTVYSFLSQIVSDYGQSKLKITIDAYFEKAREKVSSSFENITEELADFKRFFKEKSGIVIESCHGIKGEEYDVVIAFGLHERKVPYYSGDISTSNREDGKRLLFVSASRAKKHLYLFSEKRVQRINGDYFDAVPTKELISAAIEYELINE